MRSADPSPFERKADAVKEPSRRLEVVRLLGLTPAKGGAHTYPCVACASSDALSIKPGKRVAKCYSCDRAFSNVDLVMEKRGLSFVDAVEWLATELRVWVDDDRSHRGRGRRRGSYHPRPATPAAPARPATAETLVISGGISGADAGKPDGKPDASLTPADVYGALHALDELTLTDAGAAYLAARGFDPVAAEAYGFRSVDGASQWAPIMAALAERFDEATLAAAGFPMEQDEGRPARRWTPYQGYTPVLVIPYWQGGRLPYVRFRAMRDVPVQVGRYRSPKGRNTPPCPFHADALADCAGQVVHLVEGEFNALALLTAGVARVVGLPGVGFPAAACLPLVKDAGVVVAWFDDDPPRQKDGREIPSAGRAAAARLDVAAVTMYGRPWARERMRYGFLPCEADGTPQDFNDYLQRGVLRDYLAEHGCA